MRLKDPVEILYLSLLYRWESSAPPDRHKGTLDGNPEQNSQMNRLAYVLNKVGAGQADKVFRKLERHLVQNDGSSYVSKDNSKMDRPYPLHAGWYLEGCASLQQKQWILQQLTHVGVSTAFVRCADDFVAGLSVKDYFPTDAEQEEILARIRAEEATEQPEE